MGTTVVALLSGLLVAAATVAVGVGLAGTPQPAAERTIDWRRATRRYGTAAGVGLIAVAAWLATGWPVAGMLAIALVWLAPHAARAAAAQRRERQMLDATRMWLLQLRTSLQAGVGLESALRETARLARPDSPLAAPLRRMVERLDWMGPTAALQALADELDNHVADGAATVLRSALTHSSQGVTAALQALGAWADEDLRHLRHVESEARGLRLAKRLVLAVWATMALYLVASSPDLMAPYATLEGQATLLVLLGLAGLALWLLTWWSAVPRPERFFRQRAVRP
ncbi:MAG: type II secretion system F family protein [Actinobacteria bacterium]|nr:type II secretion system F family protein [Actinomycetota bacterium]